VITARPGVTVEDVLAFARGRLAGYKMPRSMEIWPELPKSGANKILRRSVRDQVVAAQQKSKNA
jgi:acyl-CoA synthetase (AMP-forming)/AMP-acid ligase II